MPDSFSKPFAPLEISQQIIDEALCFGSGRKNSTLNIAARFRRQLTPEENVAFLKREYRKGGRGFMHDGEKISVWWDESGIQIAVGDTALNGNRPTIVTWEQAERRIGELLSLGRYMPGEDLLRVEQHEVEQLAEMLWYAYRDDFGGIPSEWDAPRGGFPEDVKLIAADLRDSERCRLIFSRFGGDILRAEAERGRRWHDLRQIYSDLKAFMREPMALTTAEMTAAPTEQFITQDEIDAVLKIGSGFENGKLAIYDFFEREKDTKARIDFLRDQYGTGGSLPGIPGADDSERSYDSKGLVLSRGKITAPYAKVVLTWSKVASRTDYLITNDRYLTAEEKARLPEYRVRMEERRQAAEEERIARELERKARELEENKPKPSKDDAVYDIHIGSRVYIGTTEYFVEYLENLVVLAQVDGPLFTETYDRRKFETMLRENSLNDRLITGYKEPAIQIDTNAAEDVVDEPAEIVSDEQDKPAVEIGTELTIDDRQFVVESVTKSSVELRDVTFQQGTGFPVFRVEPIESVQRYIEHDEVKLREVVIDLRGSDNRPYESEPVDELVPAWEQHKAKPEAAPSLVGEKHNFHITDNNLGHGGAKAKYAANIAAIRLLKQLESENRYATPEEQEVLSRYVGWGGIPQAFDENNQQWAAEYAELKGLLSPDEYTSARSSVLNAFYTSPTVIKAMYEALGNMGFSSGNILEPSCGVGNFMGLLPESMSGSRMYGVELDSITGRIAKQLYQRNDIRIQGFEETDYPDSFFDVAIGNVPFGDYKLNDRKYDKNNFLIHDYFFGVTRS